MRSLSKFQEANVKFGLSLMGCIKLYSRYVFKPVLVLTAKIPAKIILEKIIDYICINGYIDSPKDLLKTPFNRPTKFIKLFDLEKQKEIARIIGEIKKNTVKILS